MSKQIVRGNLTGGGDDSSNMATQPAATRPMEFVVCRDGEISECLCGNQPGYAGFYPCDSDGFLVEPVEGQWVNLYRCDECGRIIEDETFAVVGRSRDPSGDFFVDMNKNRWGSLDTRARETLVALKRKLLKNPVGFQWENSVRKCHCGNAGCAGFDSRTEDGFAHCDLDGNDVNSDSGYQRCLRCGRVVQVYTSVHINRLVKLRPDLVKKSSASSALRAVQR